MGDMAHQFTTSYLKDSIGVFHYYKKLAEQAMTQCPDEALFTTLSAESNSIAIIVKHMAGNLRSRWTGFLTTDGEKPDRHRDTEFEAPPTTRVELLEMWERGWKILFCALEPLSDADLIRTATIRTEPHSVTQATNRQVAHYSYHVGKLFISRGTSLVINGKHSASRKRNPPSSTARWHPASFLSGNRWEMPYPAIFSVTLEPNPFALD